MICFLDNDEFDIEHFVEEVDLPEKSSPRSTHENKNGFQTHRNSDAPVKTATDK